MIAQLAGMRSEATPTRTALLALRRRRQRSPRRRFSWRGVVTTPFVSLRGDTSPKWGMLRFGSFLSNRFCGLHTIIGANSLPVLGPTGWCASLTPFRGPSAGCYASGGLRQGATRALPPFGGLRQGAARALPPFGGLRQGASRSTGCYAKVGGVFDALLAQTMDNGR